MRGTVFAKDVTQSSSNYKNIRMTHALHHLVPLFLFSETSDSVLVGQVDDSCRTSMVPVLVSSVCILLKNLLGTRLLYCRVWDGNLSLE